MARKAGYYWVKYVSRTDWSIEYWNGGMWFTRNPTLVDDSWFATIDETPIVRWQKETNEVSNCNIPHVIKSDCHHCKGSRRGIINGVEHWQCIKCKEWQAVL